MSTVLILSVGTTATPLLKAVEDHCRQTPDRHVYLLYGRPFAGQHPSPVEVVHEVRRRASELGVRVESREVSDPENLDVCLRTMRELMQEVTSAERLVIDFTGGTKPLSAAVVHAALSEPLDTVEVIFEYTGGAVRDEAGRVLREAMHTHVNQRTATDAVLRQVVGHLRRFAYRDARVLAERLPGTGRAGFVRNAVEALYAWDEFDYEASLERLRRLREAARALSDDEDLGRLARLLLTLADAAEPLARSVQALRALHDDAQRVGRWPTAEELVFLVADALENAARRLAEGRPTDGVLRCYRAVESAVQVRLLMLGVNPWRVDWDRLDAGVVSAYRGKMHGRLPRDLALTTGLTLLEVMGVDLREDLQDRLRLQRCRNYSYLEHGYLRVRDSDARRLLEHSEKLCVSRVPADLMASRRKVTHHVWS